MKGREAKMQTIKAMERIGTRVKVTDAAHPRFGQVGTIDKIDLEGLEAHLRIYFLGNHGETPDAFDVLHENQIDSVRRVAQITMPDGTMFYTHGERLQNAERIEMVDMTDAEYRAIPATIESARFFCEPIEEAL